LSLGLAQRAAGDQSKSVPGHWRALASTGDELAQRPKPSLSE
ncbi:hypothetical protein A2U01_0055461, partial [Trifolium medium]|nr:hypothetical protein [Trifolium medium]